MSERTEHDPMCPASEPDPGDTARSAECLCYLVAKVRAETIREEMALRRRVLLNLRAQVELLPVYSTRIGYEWLSPGGWQPSDRVISTIQRNDVLALLDGHA